MSRIINVQKCRYFAIRITGEKIVGLLIGVVWMVATGLPAVAEVRLGIFGQVQALTPLVVAGQTIVWPEGRAVLSPLGQTSVALGDTLAIAASLDDGALIAQRVMMIYPLIGPVDRAADGSVAVMGSRVVVPDGATVTPGTWVAVSGLWNEGKVIATRLRPVEAGGFGHLAGQVEEAGNRIGGSMLSVGRRPEAGFDGGIWMLTGLPGSEGLDVQLLVRGVFGGPVDLALWQGYASGPVASQTYTIRGTGVVGAARDAQMPQAGALVTRCARGSRVVQAAPEGLDAAFEALGCARHTPAG